MHIEYGREVRDGCVNARLIITEEDMENVVLSDYDNNLIFECEHSNKVSDKLLMYEMLARRVEETENGNN